ncbi:nuclease [Coemansia javaensis]|uniref:Endonuclease n=1 Tax=Coemansia javaensis TaxID=2761396 RepID=A0A9W8H6W2_9FUNG|nr:nuclease [Coemansia javaensis]
MHRLITFVAGAAVGGGAFYALGRARPPAQAPPAQAQAPPIPPQFRRDLAADRTDNEFLQYGDPGPVADFVVRSRYAASYNRALRNPNWVAEHLTAANLKGTADRANSEFKEDPAVPAMFRALLRDYYRSGYDRGHMCPAADAKKDSESMNETFLLTNIAPQVGNGFNRHYWAALELFVRDLTRSYDDVYCISGPMYLPHKEGDKWFVKYEVIGSPPNVAVPTHFFKVILAKRKGESAFAVGAFALPNSPIDNAIPLTDFAQPIEAVEKAAGLQFFGKIERKAGAVVPLCSAVKCELNHDAHMKRRKDKP